MVGPPVPHAGRECAAETLAQKLVGRLPGARGIHGVGEDGEDSYEDDHDDDGTRFEGLAGYKIPGEAGKEVGLSWDRSRGGGLSRGSVGQATSDEAEHLLLPRGEVGQARPGAPPAGGQRGSRACGQPREPVLFRQTQTCRRPGARDSASISSTPAFRATSAYMPLLK
ncbi:MAG: hypothetical protein ACRDN0_07990 [Trebonia sp.]